MRTNIKITYICLLLILSLAFGLRYYGFHHPHKHTFDESAYATLGYQLSQDISNYNTKTIYQNYIKAGRSLPERYNAPLFCHPPLYSFLISLLYRFLPPYFEIAHWISFCMGLLGVIMAFLLSRLLFKDNRIALLSAFLLSIDPSHIICSEKIWLTTTESFFMTTSLFFFILFLRKGLTFHSVLTGIFAGLAMLTKFTGILTLICYLGYVCIFEIRFVKRLNFWFIFLVAFLLYLPWLYWEFHIYGWQLISQNFLYSYGVKVLAKYWNIVSIGLLLLIALRLLWSKIDPSRFKFDYSKIIYLCTTIGIVSIFLFPSRFFNAAGILDLAYVPINGWFRMSQGAQWNFFFQRFLELSPLFIFAYLSFLFYKQAKRNFQILFIYLAAIFIFFIAWGNYFMSYVLAANPILAALASFCIFSIWDWLKNKDNFLKERPRRHLRLLRNLQMRFTFYRLCFIIIIGFFIVKTLFVCMYMALPNLTCYY